MSFFLSADFFPVLTNFHSRIVIVEDGGRTFLGGIWLIRYGLRGKFFCQFYSRTPPKDSQRHRERRNTAANGSWSGMQPALL